MFLLVCCALAFAQQQTRVQGTIRDSHGTPLPGVSVHVKGATQGVTADNNGVFSINVAPDAVLVFSYIGFSSQEVAVSGRSAINITLNDSNSHLDEVVVVGYGTQKKKDLTTAVVSVNTKDIEERPIVQTAGALQGKAAGVQVTQPSGKPGTAFSIRVRGATSVQAGNEPLYVIDGVPTMDTRDLNVNDIASIQVLKDASSAAIYGARAANGVVIITTKRGKESMPVISFNTYYGVSNLAKKINVLNPSQYNDLMKELGYNVQPATTTTDWLKEVFKTGHNQNYQLAFSGGNAQSQYYVSGNITRDDGIVKPAAYNRYAFRVNLDNQVKSWFKLSTNISYSNVNSKDVKDNGNAMRNAAILGALNAPPTMGIFEKDSLGRNRYTSNLYKAGWDNPLAAIDGPTQNTTDNRIFGNVSGELTLYKGLKFKSNFGIDYFNHKYDYYLDAFSTTPGRNDHGIGNSDKSNSFTYLLENYFTYDHSWKKHNVSAMAGITTQQNKYNISTMNGRDFPDDPTVKTLNAANQLTGFTEESAWFLMSYISRVMYNYDSKYLFTANFRADGSSKLAPGHQWGYFPSFSAGWRISAEPFMKDVRVINDLKIRAGWGQNGNQEGLDNYSAYGLNTYKQRTPTNPLSGPDIVIPSYIPNPNLTWETTTQTNVGIDISLFNSRLTVSADAYLKQTRDLLLNVPVPKIANVQYMPGNFGAMENKGLEFTVSSVNMDTKQFTWHTDFNISFNRNRITDMQLSPVYYFGGVEGRDNIIILKKGVALGTFYGYISEGVDPQTGNIKYKDVNGDGVITPQDRTVIGCAQPRFTYGMNNDLRFRNWGLSFLLQGSQGNDVFNASRMETEGMYDSKNQSTDVLRRWTKPGQVTDIPKATLQDVTNSLTSSRFVENGSYLRMKSITLSYNLPQELISHIKLTKLSVYVTATNIFTITKYKGFDPEVNAFNAAANPDKVNNNGATLGIDYGTYPQARSFIAGLNLQF